MLSYMATAIANRRLKERVTQTSTPLRVSIGGKPVTKQDLDSSNDWKDYPGAVLVEGVRVLNRNSSNGVVYHDPFIRRAAEIHNDHHASWEHEDVYNNQRPPKTRFGMWSNGRVVEDDQGKAVGATSDVTVYEGDPAEVQRLVAKALRNPKALSFSIEVAEGQWDGHEDDDGTIHATELTEMLDTAAVSFGGTTSSLSESLNTEPTEPTESGELTMSDASKLVENANEQYRKECACHNDTKTQLATAQQENKQLSGEVEDLKTELAELKGKVAESDRKEQVVALAESHKVTLSSDEVARYAKWEDVEIKAQLKKDQKLQESKGKRAVGSPPSGAGESTDEVSDEYEIPLI